MGLVEFSEVKRYHSDGEDEILVLQTMIYCAWELKIGMKIQMAYTD